MKLQMIYVIIITDHKVCTYASFVLEQMKSEVPLMFKQYHQKSPPPPPPPPPPRPFISLSIYTINASIRNVSLTLGSPRVTLTGPAGELEVTGFWVPVSVLILCSH